MKALSEFEDNDATRVISELIDPIENIIKNPDNRPDGKTPLAFIKNILKNNPDDLKNIFAILSETPVEEYHYTAVSLISDAMKLFNDPELLQLFGF